MGLHDRLFKQLLRAFLADFLRLVGLDQEATLRPQAARFLDKETLPDWPRGERQEVDLLAEVPRADALQGPLLVHVEVQAQARAETPRRLLRYALQLQLRHGGPVVTILVNLRGGRPGVETLEVSEGIAGLEVLCFRYLSFGVGGCRAEDYLARPEPLAWALAALMRPRSLRPAEQKLACLRQIARGRLTDAERFILLNCVETYLELSDDEERELARLGSLEGNQEGADMEMTWADKIEARGAEKGQARMLLGLLEVRFGPVAPGTRERVEQADTETLLRWGKKLLLAARLEEVLEG